VRRVGPAAAPSRADRAFADLRTGPTTRSVAKEMAELAGAGITYPRRQQDLADHFSDAIRQAGQLWCAGRKPAEPCGPRCRLKVVLTGGRVGRDLANPHFRATCLDQEADPAAIAELSQNGWTANKVSRGYCCRTASRTGDRVRRGCAFLDELASRGHAAAAVQKLESAAGRPARRLPGRHRRPWPAHRPVAAGPVALLWSRRRSPATS
jgi:hypothetical protein